MNTTSKRARFSALGALIISFVFFIGAVILAFVSGSFAVSALCWQILGGVLIWFVLVIQFHQRSRAEVEKREMSLLSSSQDSSEMFQGSADRAALFAVAGKRLTILEKWFVPFFAVGIAIYQISMGAFYLIRIDAASTDIRYRMLTAVFMASYAFVSFVISRYNTGMSVDTDFKPLRAGGSSMLLTSILSFAIAIALAFSQFKIFIGVTIMAWVVPSVLVLIGAETILNAVFDIYRPRISGQYSRSAFDSRLLGILNEPGGILHTFASAIDYQFGFKVSQTWFYKLLEKAIIPLFLLLIFTLYMLSCFVTVKPGYEGVIEHFGNFQRTVGPGLTVKLPWPFDKAYIHPTGRIQEVGIGYIADPEDEEIKPMLWGKAHYKEEYDLLVATDVVTTGDEQATVAISLVRASVPVQYKIKDIKAFMYNYQNPEKILKTICYRELTRLAGSANIEGGTEDSILGAGRRAAADELSQKIQTQADAMDLGIEIVFVGLQGVHPPPEVAQAYQQVVGAVQTKQALILNATAQGNGVLTRLSGSKSNAEQLYKLAMEYQAAEESGKTETIDAVNEKLIEAFKNAKGDIFAELSRAQSYAYEKIALAQATGTRFQGQLKAYQASPEIYKSHQLLAVREEALKDARKYVIVSDEADYQIYEIDLTEKLTPGLYDLQIEPGQ